MTAKSNDPRLTSQVPAVTRRAVPKYRPSLTAEMIEKILYLAKTELPVLSRESMSLISVLAPFQAKIENSGIQASHIVANKPSPISLEGLGAAVAKYDGEPKETYWNLCYERLQAYGAEHLSLAEIEAANEHRYLNDLMSAEEEKAHEQK